MVRHGSYISGVMTLAMLTLSVPAHAASTACFVQPRDGSGIGDLHLLTADPLDVSKLVALNVTRASAFFRDRDLAGITAELLEAGTETTLTFTFTGMADYEMLINRTVHVGEATSDPASRAYLIRYRYCVRKGRLLTAPRPEAFELQAAREALEVLRALVSTNKMLPEIRVAEIESADPANSPPG
jgi:hypothetical protein